MKKLKIKVFTILCLMLTIFLLIILAIFNYQEYKKEQAYIEQTLIKTSEINYREGLFNIMSSNITEERIFMDSVVYTVKLNEDNKILYIISYTYNEEAQNNEDKILEIIDEILEKEKDASYGNKEIYNNNLYFADYSYLFEKGNSIIITDNSTIKTRLINNFQRTLLITAVTEFFIIIASLKLASWITKPAIESFNKQKQFIEDASHELKTPLAIIVANAESLDVDEKNSKWIYNIKSEAERMNKLIMQLLDLAKLENKKQTEYSEENISKIIEKSVLTFESLLFEKNIELETNIEGNISLKCDEDDIKQLMSILIDNAISHSYKESGKIIINLAKEKNDIILKVINKGEPIPKDEEEKIFERFYKRDSSRNRDTNNYGLGLAIAKSIVSRYNGNIYAHSEDEFTTFKVLLKQVL